MKVDQLFDAMDLNADELVSKFEFLEFLRMHKPKDGSFNSVARLTETFNFHKQAEINRIDFQQVFDKLKSQLKATDFDFRFPEE